MERIKPRTLSGFMELLPEKQIYFEKMLEKLRESYSLYGFTPLDTPVIESSEILLAKGGGDTEKQIITVGNAVEIHKQLFFDELFVLASE